MKKLLISFSAIVMATAGLSAQNLQIHYDFGHLMDDDALSGRSPVTATTEMFKADSFGSTFFFIDIDCNNGVTGSYWEISRELCFWKESKFNWLSAHVEYNGGCNNKFSFDNAWLGGATYSGHSADFSKTWSLSAMYKYIDNNPNPHNFQVTGVWSITFASGLCTFSGFCDFWKEGKAWMDTDFVFFSEPQFWVNVNQLKPLSKTGLSVGGEVEITSNFYGKGFKAIPTLAAKWSF